MVRAEPSGLLRRLTIAAVVLLLHALVGFGLVRGFGSAGAVWRVVEPAPPLVSIAIPPPPQPGHAVIRHDAEGASGASGRKAVATRVAAAPALFAPSPILAAPAASIGNDPRSGANAQGEGTGGAGAGTGTGSGGAGNGAGGRFVATAPVKIAGDIREEDYPKPGRAARLGTSVTVVLTIAADGHVAACHVHSPSGSPDADTITCRVASQRFRFRPALDQNGAAIEAPFGWQQRFFWQ